jgi:single-stranded-DNA-specific exonuclease
MLDTVEQYPTGLLTQVNAIAPHLPGQYAAQLLWERGIRDSGDLAGFLNSACYLPTGPEAFGQEMDWAISRLQQARAGVETVTIWGDFDADGVTATAVLLEGLGQFLKPDQLNYWIPNRLTESHGLNRTGIQSLQEQGCQLIVTCDTGCTNHDEIEFAQGLGIDVIVTDHHTLASTRPPVVAMINPRQLEVTHPLAKLSGVAVAYKLVEAWYLAQPQIPTQKLEELLDLVAIGLIADLVELKGDCRYLAQRGLKKLQTRLQDLAIRPGVGTLLKLCKKAGDRPTDISFGIGPRINAVSRIQGDASFCVELLTSRDPKRCEKLAIATELANSRRKELQQRIKQEAIAEVEQLDLSTTQAIVIAKSQWPVGILGLVAGELAQRYERPTVLLTLEAATPETKAMAKGSARSVHGIDLYELMAAQSHLLTKFGGHPFAAGLSLLTENIELLSQGLNHALRLHQKPDSQPRSFDLIVTVKELGQPLFKELQLLEPYGMGNPVPKLLIRDCWFEEVYHRNLEDRTGKKLKYIRAVFKLWDESSPQGFPGVWWEHYKEDVPTGRCNVIAELDFNNFSKQPEIRIVEIQEIEAIEEQASSLEDRPEIIDYRNLDWDQAKLPEDALLLDQCPRSWAELGRWVRRSRLSQRPLALVYGAETEPNPVETWQLLVGIAKAAIRSGDVISRSQLKTKLSISGVTLNAGLSILKSLGLRIQNEDSGHFIVSGALSSSETVQDSLNNFLTKVREERFQSQYFQQIPLRLIQTLESADQKSLTR